MSEQKKHEVHVQKGKEAADGAKKKEPHPEDKRGEATASASGAEIIAKDHVNEDEIERLKTEIEAKEKTIADYLNQIKRTQADFENYIKRVEKEREDAALSGACKLLCEIISVADDLERSIAASKKNHDAQSLSKGVDMVHKKLMSILAKEGIEKIECVGKQFDPRMHEAVMAAESKELKDNTVIEELEKGYVFRNKVLRPAKVKVARNE